MFTLKKFPRVGGPGVYMEEQGVSAIDNSDVSVFSNFTCHHPSFKIKLSHFIKSTGNYVNHNVKPFMVPQRNII